MFDNVLRTWFERGVDGFRIDVAYAMVKHPDLPDAERPENNAYSWNQPGVHDIFARWRAIADSYQRDIPLIGEVWLSAAEAADYIRPGRLNQVFYFDLLVQPWDAQSFRDSIDATVASVPPGGGVATWTLNNHDVHRAVSRYGLIQADPMDTDDANAPRIRPRGQVDVQLGVQRARAAALLLLALPGSAYLYQGEELGLPEVMDLPADARRDPIWIRSGGREYGRDGSRVPLPWEPVGASLGFSPAGSAPPWLPQPDWFRDFATSSQQGDPGSTLNLYRTALRMRRSLFNAEDFEWLSTDRADVIAFRRGAGISVTVMGDKPFDLPADWGKVTVRSSGGTGETLGPGTGAWLIAT
jgi:alpha-glucosidase